MLLGRPIRLDLASLQDKLVRRRRGGYCFEQVTLFAAVLERLGFAPVRHTARVIRVVPRTEAPRSHMLRRRRSSSTLRVPKSSASGAPATSWPAC